MKTIAPVMLAVIAVFFFQACTNKDVAKPFNTAGVSQQLNEDAPPVASLKNPSPGNYWVKLYVENADTSTKEFKGYVFTFKPNGVLLAKIDSTTYTGKWESKDNGKELKLDIKGTTVLDDVDKSWNVLRIIASQISLKDNEGQFGDRLVLAKIK